MSELEFHAFIEPTQLLGPDDNVVSHYFCVIVVTQVIEFLRFILKQNPLEK